MARSLWKGLFLGKVFNSFNNTYMLTDRDAKSINLIKDKVLSIYNGKQLVPIKFNKDEMHGHSLGEFVFTKKKCVKQKKDKKNFKLKK